jgi:hypothetical protein
VTRGVTGASALGAWTFVPASRVGVCVIAVSP